ncbi:MAG: ABC transporter ATP-binding protein [Sneathiellaceae bacterium]
MSAGTKISVRGVSKLFRTAGGEEVLALDRTDLEIRNGEFVSIVGPSGCGKSTLLNLIAGFEQPTDGRVEVDGRRIERPGADRGVVFQNYALFPWLSVAQNIAFGPRSIGCTPREVRERVARCISLVKLDGFDAKYPHELSGGMSQRCALARCIANDPDVMLMDEPLAALDAFTRETLQDELLRIWSEASHQRSKTVVYVTHAIDEALFLSDRVVVMQPRPGRVLDIVDVPFARPRAGEMRLQPDFHALQAKVWRLLNQKTEEEQRRQ